ncbi:MAG: hypothetical protein U0641_02730 [Anaerolineae bacterium]
MWLSVEQRLTAFGRPKPALGARRTQFESGMVGDAGVFGYADATICRRPPRARPSTARRHLDPLVWRADEPARPSGEIVAVLLRWTPGGPVAPEQGLAAPRRPERRNRLAARTARHRATARSLSPCGVVEGSSQPAGR